MLLYLHTHKKEDRLSSPEKLGQELGISEQTVTGAYDRLRRRGCIFPPPNAGKVRDPREFTVTWRGKRALRPLLNAIGYGDVVILCFLASALGVAVGGFYPSSQLYPSYSHLVLLIIAVFAVVFLGYAAYVAQRARKNRRDELRIILNKPSPTAEEPSS